VKDKTRRKLAARGLGPLVRPGRPGRGRRGALAPERRAEAPAGVSAEQAQPVVREDGPLGEFVEPRAESVRERVRLRPVVRDALDAEAGRLGMTREGLCRFVLEEVARKAVDASASEQAADAPDGDAGAVIPAGYVGAGEEEAGEPPSAGRDSVASAGDALSEVVAESAADAGPPAERALLPAGGRRLRVRAVRGARRLCRVRGRARVLGAWVAVLAVALLVALSAGAAAVSWRYEVAGTGGDGVYVVDRWRGAVWRCGAAGRGRPPACAEAVFRQPAGGGAEVAYLGRAPR